MYTYTMWIPPAGLVAVPGSLVSPLADTFIYKPWDLLPYTHTHMKTHRDIHTHVQWFPARTGLRNSVCPVAAPGSPPPGYLVHRHADTCTCVPSSWSRHMTLPVAKTQTP